MALYCLWNCNQCGLLNYNERDHCQACFNKTTQKSAIYSLQKQQRALFDGFIRTEILIDSQSKYHNIPTYFFDFCFAFFGIYIKLLCVKETTTQQITKESVFEFGRMLLKNEEYFFSYQILSTLIKYHPESAEFHNAMGVLHSQWGNGKDAITEYENAIQIAPTNAVIKRNYGRTLMKQKKWKLALQQLEDAYKSDSTNVKSVIKMAECYEQIENYTLSNIYFLKGIELAPIEWKPYCRYAKYLRDRGEYENADKYYQISLGICPNQRWLNSSYAYLLYLMGKFDVAQEYIELALRINGANKWAHYYKGLLYKEFGNEQLAKESLLTAIQFCKKIDSMLPFLEKLKQQDPKNMEYHDRCAELLKDKFKSV